MFNNLMQPPQPPQQHPQQPLTSNYFSPVGQPTLQNFSQLQGLSAPGFPQFNQAQVQLLAQQLLLNPQLREALQQPVGSPGQQQASNDQAASARPTPDDVDIGMASDSASIQSDEDKVEQLTTPKKNKGKGRARSNSYDRSEIQRAIRSKPPRSKEPTFTSDQGIFVDDWGIPKKFYIMVDLKNRKDLLKIVKVPLSVSPLTPLLITHVETPRRDGFRDGTRRLYYLE
jgi:hypothetical protein